jgi:oligo-1,6-glucosidase
VKNHKEIIMNAMNQKWWRNAVVYQIYPRSFYDSNGDGIGDINGILAKLDYLNDLGVDIIWLSPVYKSPNDDNGYDISDYQAIMAEFGTMEDFDRLLAAAHEHGIRIMMDLVINHTSDEHRWFAESRKSLDNDYRDFYIWRKGQDSNPPNNWGGSFSGSAWQYSPETDMYFLHLFSTKQPDLNWENAKVRQEVYNMMTWWLDKGIDGFRMDVINMISKVEGFPNGEVVNGLYGNGQPYYMNGPRIHEYLKEMNREVLSKYDIVTVGETPCVTVADARRYTGENEHELNMVFQFEHMDLDLGPQGKWCENRILLADLKNTISKWQTGLAGTGWNSLYWNNHDQPRVVSRLGNDKNYWQESAKMLATCLHMMQGTPYIFQGEELGMTNVRFESLEDYRDIETLNAYDELVGHGIKTPEEMLRCIHKGSRDNARTPIQWDDSDNAGFSTSTPWIKVNPNYRQINAANQVNDPDSIFNYYKQLIQLRKKHDIIVFGLYHLILEEHDQVFAYTRNMGDQKLIVLCNFSDRDAAFTLPTDLLVSESHLLIGNYSDKTVGSSFEKLRPFEAKVFLITLVH